MAQGSKAHIGLVIPTRGTVFTDAVNSAISQLQKLGNLWDFRMTSILPLPDCFNYPISELLNRFEAMTHIWIVEEDIVTSYNALERLISCQADISVIDYPMRNGNGSVTTFHGDILWAGTGCMLIRRQVLEKIGYPYFRNDVTYWIRDGGVFEQKKGVKTSYGGHDIHFGLECRRLGFKIKKVEGITGKHLEIFARGKSAANDGVHGIKEHKDITVPGILHRFTVRY